ncbi:MAG: F0F1 ATP synthase subunit epsilon [Lysobacterales bacterium]|jgi:F-type H+-transporting ATPase subunit epsilon
MDLPASTIHCDIVSAHEQIYSGDVKLCVAVGGSGEIGIYPRHAPLMTTLKPGPFRVLQTDGEEIVFVIGGGILEVMPHLVTVLADTAIRADDVDEAAALRAKEEAERILATRTGQLEFQQAEAQLIKALEELRALETLRKRTKR